MQGLNPRLNANLLSMCLGDIGRKLSLTFKARPAGTWNAPSNSVAPVRFLRVHSFCLGRDVSYVLSLSYEKHVE